jgi:hypothetical protein
LTPGLITASASGARASGGKELHFFDVKEFFAEGLRAYARRFPACPVGGSGKKAIDATPAYMRCPNVVERIHRSYSPILRPQLRFMVILRDPTERLRSWFDHMGHKKTNLPAGPWALKNLGDLLACSRRRTIDARDGALWGSECNPPCFCGEERGALTAGLYAPQVISARATPLSAPTVCSPASVQTVCATLPAADRCCSAP